MPELPFAKQLALGLSAPLRGLGVLFTHRRLLGLAIANGVLALCVLVTVMAGAGWAAWALAQHWLEGGWRYLGALAIFIAMLPLSFVVFRILASIVCSFLYEALALAAERIFAPDSPPESGRPWVAEIVEELRYELRVLPRTLKHTGIALLLNVIPLLGQLLAAGYALWTVGRESAHELLEVPFERRGLGPAAIDEELERHGPLWHAVGLATLALAFIPVLNLLSMSGGVVGTSWLLAELESMGHVFDAGEDLH